MNKVICKTGIIVGSKIHPKGSILSIPEDISPETVEQLMASGEEIQEYTGKEAKDKVQVKTPTIKPLPRKEMIAKLKELGAKVPFGLSNEALAKMLEEVTSEKA